MNRFKLLPCGRIIFYVSRLSSLGVASFPDIQCQEDEGLSHDERPGEEAEIKAVPLGSSHALISDNPLKPEPRLRRGSKGITPHGRNIIRAGCHWLEETVGVKNLTFFTATLPDEAMRLCTPETWALVVNRFEKSLRYHLEAKGLCCEIVGCTEIQEKRLLTTDGIPPLHLHLLFQGRKPYHHWSIDKGEYQRLWKQACISVWQIEAEFGQSCRSESVKTSGVSYMSKYLSKGGSILSQCNPDLLPSAWFTASRNLKEIIKRTIIRGENYLAITLYEQLQESNILKWVRDVWSVEHGDGSQYLVAWVGQIASRETYWRLKAEIECCIYGNTEIQNREYTFLF